MVNHGLVVAGDLHRDRDPLRAHPDRGPDRDGRPGDARAGARRALPGGHDGDPGDARARPTSSASSTSSTASSRRRSRSPSSPRSGSRWPPSTPCASTSGRCTTGSRRAPSRARSRLRDGVVLAPLVACIVALALWPGPDPRARRGLGRARASSGGASRRRRGRGDVLGLRVRPRRAASMNFNAPDIDYAGLSPIIALTGGAGAGAARRAVRRQRATAADRRLDLRPRHPRRRRRALHLAVGRDARTWSPGALRLDDLALAASLIAIALGRLLHPALLARGGGRPAARARAGTASSRRCCSARCSG